MITKNPMQLKAIIKNKAQEKNISAQLVMQNYMLERLLERISISRYRNNFILKGRFLISAIVGLDTRATSKSATQQIDIYFRYIGKLAPEEVA